MIKAKQNGGVSHDEVLARAAAAAQQAVTRPLESRGKARSLADAAEKERFEDWLRGESDPAKKSQCCVRFVLFQVTKDDEKGVAAFAIAKGTTDREPLVDACHKKFEKTSRFISEALGPGLHHFYVASYRTESNEDELPNDQHHFIVTGSEDSMALGAVAFGGGGSATEALGHSMRLFDTLIRSNAELMRSNADRYLEQLTHQQTLIADLTSRSLEQTVQLQEALDRKALRDVEVQHKVMRLDAEFKAYGAAINYLLPLVTHVLSQKTGFDPAKVVAAQSASAGEQFMAAAQKLKPRQVAMLVLTLDQEQQERLPRSS